jgi:hypothetical protein
VATGYYRTWLITTAPVSKAWLGRRSVICSDSGGEDVIGVRRAAEARMSDCECSGRGVSERSCTVQYAVG